MLVPGLGQLLAGARRRGLLLLGATAVLLAVVLAGAVWLPGIVSIDRRLVAGVLAVDLALLGVRLFAVLDAGRGSRAPAAEGGARRPARRDRRAARRVRVRDRAQLRRARERVRGRRAAGRAARPRALPRVRAVAAAAGSGPTAGELGLAEQLGPGETRPLVRSPEVLARPPSGAPTQRPWTTILLIGTDEGPGNWGARTDTIIVVAAQHGTGRAAAFGIPRNLAQVAVGGKLKRFREPLNGLYAFARERPELFPGGADPGATALKQAVSQAARRSGRLLRARQPARVRRPRRRARRRPHPRQGAARRLGHAAGVGRAEAADRRRARGARTTSTAARHSRTSARARPRATTRAWRGSAAS